MAPFPYEQLNALHHHLCPKQVLGVRVALYAAEWLALDLPRDDKRLFTFVETDGCFADGVSFASGCWVGHRTLRIMDYGKVAATFVDTQNGRAVRIWPTVQSRARAWQYAPTAPDRWHAQLAAYQVMPAAELLNAHVVTLTVSLERIISRHGLRVVCARCGEDIINERQVIVEGMALCRACSGEAYYTMPETATVAL